MPKTSFTTCCADCRWPRSNVVPKAASPTYVPATDTWPWNLASRPNRSPRIPPVPLATRSISSRTAARGRRPAACGQSHGSTRVSAMAFNQCRSRPGAYNQVMNRPHQAIRARPPALRTACRRQPPWVARRRGRLALGLCILVGVVASCDDSPRQPLQQATRGIQRERIGRLARMKQYVSIRRGGASCYFLHLLKQLVGIDKDGGDRTFKI